MKLVWDVPRSTHTYLVDNFLAINHISVKKQLLSRYVNFFRSLLNSKSKEVMVLANVVSRDMRSVTGKNLLFIERESGLDPWKSSSANVRNMLPNSKVPEADMWRLPLLCKYIYLRKDMKIQSENTEKITSLIDSLCSS